jgi:hypothetical protein
VGLEAAEHQETFYAPSGLVDFKGSLNPFFEIDRFISLRDNVVHMPPEHLPDDVQNAFMEGAACISIACNNAAAAMFRLCLDIVTRPLLPEADDASRPQPNRRQRRDLGLRLPWLFEEKLLPDDLQELSTCIREDGNDGAHVGNLSKEDAEDVLDFTRVLLERLFTQPNKLALAKERRDKRREPKE